MKLTKGKQRQIISDLIKIGFVSNVSELRYNKIYGGGCYDVMIINFKDEKVESNYYLVGFDDNKKRWMLYNKILTINRLPNFIWEF